MFGFLAQLISKGFLFFALHIRNPGSFPPALSAKEERKQLECYKNGSVEAKNILIEHNLRLVAHIVKNYYSTSDEQDDLISIGTIGLIKAVNTFDDSKNIKIATYASKCIENEILMFMRSRKKSAHDISINEPIDTDGEGNPLTLMDIISVEDTIADDIDQKIKVKRLYELVEGMTDPRERSILIMRYGLYSTDPMTQRQIASRLGISRSYVSRIEKKAIERLREGFGE